MISTVSYSQVEIIDNILALYCQGGVECDPAYGRGVFYRNRVLPVWRYDIDPKGEGVVQADCRKLPLADHSVNSIMFDPPFVAGGQVNGRDGVMKSRYGIYPTIPLLWEMYRDSLREFARVLTRKGVLIFKCQDTVAGRMQCLSHVEIINQGLRLGFYPEDLFILVAKNRMIREGQKVQIHARKYHSYFIVFVRRSSTGHYSI